MAQENATESISDTAFAAVLRDAIIARGVTLAWLNSRLRANGNPVSMATLSYWRSGARRPEGVQSLAAVTDIEDLLDLPFGALTGLLGRSLRIGPVGAADHPMEGGLLKEAVGEVFAALGEPQYDRVRDVTTHAVTDVGPDGAMIRRTVRSIIQSMSGLVTSVPYVEMTPGVPTPPPIFSMLGGGRITQTYSHASGEVHGFCFELDHPIDTAETTVIEWCLELPDDYPATFETGHGVSRQCRELMLWTRFHPDALPDWIDELIETPESAKRMPKSLGDGTTLHQVHRKFGPGVIGLDWGFGERDAAGDPNA